MCHVETNGNYKPKIVPSLDRNIITSPDEIADTFAGHYAKDLHRKANHSTRRGYYSFPDDKKIITRDTEVPARYVQ